jgi:hypothetical protein
MATAAGWYTDPWDPASMRWWDGVRWTKHVQAPTASSPPGPPPVTPIPPPPPPTSTGTPHAHPAAASGPGIGSVTIPATVVDQPKGGIFNGGKKALEAENAELRAALAAIGATEREQIRVDIEALRAGREALLDRLHEEEAALRARLAVLGQEIVAVEEEAILQEVGIYRYRHPLDSAVAYKDQLASIQAQAKELAKTGHAVIGATNWQVNGSTREGTKMVRDFSKLMLRAYNNEADHAVRSLKPYKLQPAIDRLEKARATISRLGKTMSIEVTSRYHALRVEELRLTADYAAKLAEEKEQEREERARLREEERVKRELERERARLAKEEAHYRGALVAMQQNGDAVGVAEAEAKLAEIHASVEGIAQREANVRAGYVYVITNVGAFGERMVKVGMTRRLDPMDRVRELGDASVPFRYDVHAIIFSHDAVGLETQLHQRLTDRRVNLVNRQREFFYATPTEVRDLLGRIDGNSVLSFDEHPEALEWHQSQNARKEPSGIMN